MLNSVLDQDIIKVRIFLSDIIFYVHEDWTLQHITDYGSIKKENCFQITVLVFIIVITIRNESCQIKIKTYLKFLIQITIIIIITIMQCFRLYTRISLFPDATPNR